MEDVVDSIFKTATAIGTPLALSGFVCAALFLLFRQILAKKVFPDLGAALGADVLKLVIKCLFALALVGMILGVASFLLVSFWSHPSTPDVHASRDDAAVVPSPQGSFDASNGDTFLRVGDQWQERPKGAGLPSFTFVERGSDEDAVLLYDGTRDMYLRLPAHGGVSQWKQGDAGHWTDWIPVVRRE